MSTEPTYYRLRIDAQTTSIDDLIGLLMSISGQIRRGAISGDDPAWQLITEHHTADEVSDLYYQASEAIEDFAMKSGSAYNRARGKLEDIDADYPDDLDGRHARLTELLQEIAQERQELGLPELTADCGK